MRDKDDPFISVLRTLEGRDGKLAEVGAKVTSLYESTVANVYMTAYLLIVALVILLFSSPFLLPSADAGARGVGAFMHVSAGLLQMCHQLPHRSFMFDGIPMAVCARDTGIYLGFIAGVATAFMRKRPKILSEIRLPVLAALPMAVDGVTQTVLVMRESNDAIRVVTGFAFAFGAAAYLVNRFFLRRYPDFRQRVLDPRWILIDASVVVIVLYLFFTGFGEFLGVEYMSRDEALTYARENTEISEPFDVRAYYIGSMTVLSVMGDPYYEDHRDLILTDIRESQWARDMMEAAMGEHVLTEVQDDTRTPSQVIADVSEKDHKFGVWVAAVLKEEPVKGAAPFMREGQGEFFFFDAISGDLIMRTNH